MAAGRRKQAAPVPFPAKLVLNQWMLSMFDVKDFKLFAAQLGGEAMEGLDQNNVHHFHHTLTTQLFNQTAFTSDELLHFDQNIVRHTQRVNERRVTRGEDPIVWKYFQYLALLFTEVYLDRYFRDPEELRSELNVLVEKYNQGKAKGDKLEVMDDAADAWSQLNKLAYWMATGSGKTLLMHVNILQYRHYLTVHGREKELNRVLLLTPNEGLSQQHLEEFRKAGIEAELFDGSPRSLYSGKAVEIIDIHKLKETQGEKTFAIDSFEGNNLVLVDEGHRGASGGDGGTWMKHRNVLCARGFSFEYSATFGQAVKGDKALQQTYAKSILFDYSYRYFYQDGFGKDYQILNLDEGTQSAHFELYLTACLLTFFQQQRLFREQESAFRPFQLEKPLWIFVGGSVNAVRTKNRREVSDVVEILQFLSNYAANRSASIERIDSVLKCGLRTAKGNDLFAGRFGHLRSAGLSAEQVFDETLATLFNAPGGGRLYVENLKGAAGEIALRLGEDNDAFGVINVGDDSKLVKLCEANGIETREPEFAKSLFRAINDEGSTVNLLIGSKKFTEGWSSWRVSTMGLMNVGKSEGAQIIQLFGRGVRLKGYERSLKRSMRAALPEGLKPPKHIGSLETLGVFGVHADYMAQFREFLKEEGMPANEEREEIYLPVIRNLGTQKLRMPRLQKTIQGMSTEHGDPFKRLGPVPTLAKPDPSSEPGTDYLQRNRVVLNWYPKIRAEASEKHLGADAVAAPNEEFLTEQHVAFLDIDALYFELERFKAERAWFNFNLSRPAIQELLYDKTWYRLQIPASEMSLDSFERVRLWQEIATALVKSYAERLYTFRKRQWELPHLEYRELDENDPNLQGVHESPDDDSYYRVLIDTSQDEIKARLTELKSAIQSGEIQDLEFSGVKVLTFDRHLYEPLLYIESKVVEISPTPLNKGEMRFVEDLKRFHTQNSEFFAERELYLLRNQSRGRGVGFFEAGNFHPDFILWLVTGERQLVIFVDPKGLRNEGVESPKLAFHRTIKDIEERLGDASMRLESFIVSRTTSAELKLLTGMDKSEFEARHVVFQDEDRDSYIGRILAVATAVPQA
ncbi:MAG: DEAD/DEAH box helicase family protein [Planctomycetes bacterium]|nr:DEAD/DEAH box helicase family protein [Planctomycetota bacterium]